MEWKFEDEPSLDDAAKELIGEMPKGPVVFEDGNVVRPPVPQPSDIPLPVSVPASGTATPKVSTEQP